MMVEYSNKAYQKICKYCAYQERSHWQVRMRLIEYNLTHTEVEEIISQLIIDNFLNEERFTRAFVGGKFRLKKWGRNKIIQGLRGHRVSPKCIEIGISEIDEEEYQQMLVRLIEKKRDLISSDNSFIHLHKVANYAIGKGFEPELVYKFLKMGKDIS